MALDQCPTCGGVWCDKLELYRVSHHAAHKLENIKPESLSENKPINKKLICPKCHKEMIKLDDPYFPSQIAVECCPECFGFWLNRGELVEFKNWQQAKKEAIRKQNLKKEEEIKKEKELKKQLARLLIKKGGITPENIDNAALLLGQRPIDRVDPEIQKYADKLVKLIYRLQALRPDVTLPIFIILTIFEYIYDYLKPKTIIK